MLLHEISAKNLLSFGPQGMTLPLRPLNVLIGPNGSGKSNFIELISLLQATPTRLAEPIRRGGGIREWVRKGSADAEATLEAILPFYSHPRRLLSHLIEFSAILQKFVLANERIAWKQPELCKGPEYFYELLAGGDRPRIWKKDGGFSPLDDIPHDVSILSQIRDRGQYPELTFLGHVYERIRLYREWSFGRHGELRQPQPADQPNDQLEPDCRNLGLVLNRLRGEPSAKRVILENLQQLYPGIEDYDVSVEGGTVQLFLQESGFKIPATRLSDGTLRYLCLLAILCDPKPPPLVCIEEPELGLHPDIMPTMARLLKEASTRTQLIVTTHSDILVDELSDDPESVVVCDKVDGSTTMTRLDAEKLAEWLKKYRLGELWTKGELGGVRW